MPKVTIDNQVIDVPDGTTILQAARRLGIPIPALCWREGCAPGTSCMACIVRLHGSGRFVPACATPVQDGLVVESETDELRAARRTNIELLLSDHLGDCVGPCERACPAGMDIPLMTRQIAAGQLPQALATIKRRIPLPATLGRICPAPCEKACRRGRHDQPVAICLLKRFVADADLAAQPAPAPGDAGLRAERQPASTASKHVAIVGAGPAGLSAAWFLLAQGHRLTVFEAEPKAGGLLHSLPPGRLPPAVIEAEAALVTRRGAELRPSSPIGRQGQPSLSDLLRGHDAVLVACGTLTQDEAGRLGLPVHDGKLVFDRHTHQAAPAGLFLAHDRLREPDQSPSLKLIGPAIRAIADARAAALCIGQFLAGRAIAGPHRPFNVHIGHLHEDELKALVAQASAGPRVTPAPGRTAPAAGQPGEQPGLTNTQAVCEALRCLHCDCRRKDDCRLREWSAATGSSHLRFKSQRRALELRTDHPRIVYEPGKCISCGLCVQITARMGEPLGLALHGRGFRTRVVVPFGHSLEEALTVSAEAVVAACPTGAFAWVK